MKKSLTDYRDLSDRLTTKQVQHRERRRYEIVDSTKSKLKQNPLKNSYGEVENGASSGILGVWFNF